MSHRVTVQTEIKDRALAIEALKAAGIQYREQGEVLYLTGQGFDSSTLNLKTGAISGDTDYGHNAGKLGVLRQHYAEAQFKQESFRQGISIQSRTVDKDGNVVLHCRTA